MKSGQYAYIQLRHDFDGIFQTILKPNNMSRQQINNQRDRKTEETRRDAASHAGRYSRSSKDPRPEETRKDHTRQVSGPDRYVLNDLYERSSV